MYRFLPLAAVPLMALLTTDAIAAEAAPAATNVLTGEAAFGNWQKDRPGVRRLIRPDDLQRPFVTESASTGPDTVMMPQGAKPWGSCRRSYDEDTTGLRQSVGPPAGRVDQVGCPFG